MIQPLSEAAYPRLLEIWESAVRATHGFLEPEDFDYYHSKLPDYLVRVHLFGYIEPDGRILGFAGVSGDELVMLFVDDAFRGKGVGRQLLECVISEGVRTVEVNEQNAPALGFYEHAGFRIVSRKPFDSEGKPYPILRLER